MSAALFAQPVNEFKGLVQVDAGIVRWLGTCILDDPHDIDDIYGKDKQPERDEFTGPGKEPRPVCRPAVARFQAAHKRHRLRLASFPLGATAATQGSKQASTYTQNEDPVAHAEWQILAGAR